MIKLYRKYIFFFWENILKIGRLLLFGTIGELHSPTASFGVVFICTSLRIFWTPACLPELLEARSCSWSQILPVSSFLMTFGSVLLCHDWGNVWLIGGCSGFREWQDSWLYLRKIPPVCRRQALAWEYKNEDQWMIAGGDFTPSASPVCLFHWDIQTTRYTKVTSKSYYLYTLGTSSLPWRWCWVNFMPGQPSKTKVPGKGAEISENRIGDRQPWPWISAFPLNVWWESRKGKFRGNRAGMLRTKWEAGSMPGRAFSIRISM